MTKEERLAALKNLESGLQTEIIRATASPDQGFYCVKLDKNADLDLVEEFRIYADLKWEVSYFFTLPSMNHYIGLNYVSQEAATNLRTGFLEWVKAEIAKIEQPAPTKTASALPYKVLLNSMDSRMGYDEEDKHHWLFVSTDANDSQMLFHDIGQELTESTGAVLRIMDMESLYMLFKTKTKFDSEAREIESKVVEWLKRRIAEIEQPPFDPKEVIEAAAADQEGMDAAESDAGREVIWAEVMIPVGDWKATVRHLYKALSAGYATDDEIAALKKENVGLKDHVQRLHEIGNQHLADMDNLSHDLAFAQNDVQRLNELLNEYKAAEPKDVQPAPVRLPAAGDTIEIPSVHGPVGTWDKVVTYMKCGEVKYDAGLFTPTADEYGLKRGMWRWPGPRTRTAADAKVGEIVLFWDTMQTREHGPVIGLGDSSVFVQASDGKVHRLPHHEFGSTGWRFEKEQPK